MNPWNGVWDDLWPGDWFGAAASGSATANVTGAQVTATAGSVTASVTSAAASHLTNGSNVFSPNVPSDTTMTISGTTVTLSSGWYSVSVPVNYSDVSG